MFGGRGRLENGRIGARAPKRTRRTIGHSGHTRRFAQRPTKRTAKGRPRIVGEFDGALNLKDKLVPCQRPRQGQVDHFSSSVAPELVEQFFEFLFGLALIHAPLLDERRERQSAKLPVLAVRPGRSLAQEYLDGSKEIGPGVDGARILAEAVTEDNHAPLLVAHRRKSCFFGCFGDFDGLIVDPGIHRFCICLIWIVRNAIKCVGKITPNYI